MAGVQLLLALAENNDSENLATIYCKDIPTVSKDFLEEVVGNDDNEESGSQTEKDHRGRNTPSIIECCKKVMTKNNKKEQ